jgi:circadian clock protein KaiB
VNQRKTKRASSRKSSSRKREAKREAANSNGKELYVFRLYITGVTPRSTQAILNLKEICERYLSQRYTLEVVDIYQQPAQAREHQIIAAPTVIKHLPLPVRRFIGDMSKPERILISLNLSPAHANESNRENDGQIPHTPRF